MLEILYHQIHSDLKDLKYLISFLVILLLFILNGFFFSVNYQEKINAFSQFNNDNIENLKKASLNLNILAFTDYQVMKRPLTSSFIVGNKQNIFPDSYGISVQEITFPQKSEKNSMFNTILIDWLFIISIIGSFLVFVLSYDAISGEREQETLKLVFSNNISKLEFVFGKLLGITASLMVAILLGVVINLLIISIINNIPVMDSLLIRICIFIVICSVFLLFMTSLGLLISFLCKSSLKSLVILTLIWIVFVFIIPVISRVISTTYIKIDTLTEFEYKYRAADYRLPELIIKYDGAQRGREAGKIDNYQKEKGLARAMSEVAEEKQNVQDQYIEGKISQAILYTKLCALSPIYLFSNIIEILFHSGIEKEIDLRTQVKSFQMELINFYKKEDIKDPISPHVYFLRDYFSKEAVDWRNISSFQEKPQEIITSLINSFNLFIILIIELGIVLFALCRMFSHKNII